MSGRTILISPLNWGFGHAGRMIPLALELRRRGNEVVFGADAELLPLIEGALPGIRLIEIPGLHIRYSRRLPQYVCIFLQMPKVILSAVREQSLLRRLAGEIKPDVIISDNRFGLYHRKIFSVYVTHQLRIPFPRLLSFMEPLAAWLHRKIINRYNLCLVPDYPGRVNLSGRLSHSHKVPGNVHYMGPLSRFGGDAAVDLFSQSMAPASIGPLRAAAPANDRITTDLTFCSLILSGPEPQRTMLFERVRGALRGVHFCVLSPTPLQAAGSSDPGFTLIIKPNTDTMRDLVSRSTIVITRSGYTSLMELVSMGKGAVLIPTPGQPEQEYLGEYLNGRHGFITIRQSETGRLTRLVKEWEVMTKPASPDGVPKVEPVVTHLPDSAPLFEKAINLLPDRKIV